MAGVMVRAVIGRGGTAAGTGSQFRIGEGATPARSRVENDYAEAAGVREAIEVDDEHSMNALTRLEARAAS
jgi:hypothetical protein